MKHAEPNNSRSKEEQTGERAVANEQSVATNESPWQLTRRRLLASAATAESRLGETETGVVYFIDRQLNSSWVHYARRCDQGPFAPGDSTQGDQSALNLRDRYPLSLLAFDNYSQVTFKASFVELTPRRTRATTRPGPWTPCPTVPPTRWSSSTCRVSACWRR